MSLFAATTSRRFATMMTLAAAKQSPAPPPSTSSSSTLRVTKALFSPRGLPSQPQTIAAEFPSLSPSSIFSRWHNISSAFDFLMETAIWFNKRTYQPSLQRKKRKCGFLKRSKTRGGRAILKRRQQKGRARLFGA